MPNGHGLWPAFWMLNENQAWPPEIDVSTLSSRSTVLRPVFLKILECFGQRPYQFHWAVHSNNNSFGAGNWAYPWANTQDSFHNYGAIWTAESISFYFDDQLTVTVPTPPDNKQDPMYLLANLAIGG